MVADVRGLFGCGCSGEEDRGGTAATSAAASSSRARFREVRQPAASFSAAAGPALATGSAGRGTDRTLHTSPSCVKVKTQTWGRTPASRAGCAACCCWADTALEPRTASGAELVMSANASRRAAGTACPSFAATAELVRSRPTLRLRLLLRMARLPPAPLVSLAAGLALRPARLRASPSALHGVRARGRELLPAAWASVCGSLAGADLAACQQMVQRQNRRGCEGIRQQI